MSEAVNDTLTERERRIESVRSTLDGIRSQTHRRRFHLAMGMAFMASLPVATAPKEVISALLIVAALLRLPGGGWAAFRPILLDRAGWIATGWAIMTLASVGWSPDPEGGFVFARCVRFMLIPVAMWPLAVYGRLLVIAFLVGVAGLNLIQLAQQFELLGLAPDWQGRLAGKLHPIHAGSFCAAAACLHLSHLLATRTRMVVIVSVIGGASAALGLILTGSRGPWLAAAAAIPVVVLVTGLRRPETRVRIAMLSLAAIAAAGASWPIVGSMVTTRVSQAWDELSAARAGDLDTENGFRLSAWRAAADFTLDAPLIGLGAGGFPVRAAADDQPESLSHGAHPHSAYLHVSSEQGFIGLCLFLAMLIAVMARAFAIDRSLSVGPGIIGVLVVWYVGAQFDASQAAGQMLAFFAVVMLLVHPATRLGPWVMDDAGDPRQAE